MNLFLIAGEHSGDLHGSHLLRALQKEHPEALYAGVGGPFMREQKFQLFLPMEQFQIIGFSGIVRHLPRVVSQFRQIRDHILSQSYDAVIFVDYPGFNLRMAQALRKRGYKGKLIQYICPSVWAWGKGRIETMAKTLDLLICFFPFEPPLFAHTQLPVAFCGHPLATSISPQLPASEPSLLAVFPGSRKREVETLLPRQLEAARLLREKYPQVQIAVSQSDPELEVLIQKAIEQSGLKGIEVYSRDRTQELMSHSRVAIAKSGTVTLELALHGVPSVVVYHLDWINYLILRYAVQINLPYYSIVNIIKNEQVFPEFMTGSFTAEEIFHPLAALYVEGGERAVCLQKCEEVGRSLRTSIASPVDEASKRIWELVAC